jgi:hypothetical protein
VVPARIVHAWITRISVGASPARYAHVRPDSRRVPGTSSAASAHAVLAGAPGLIDVDHAGDALHVDA